MSIIVDAKALDGVGVDPDVAVTLTAKGIPVVLVLDVLLTRDELSWAIRDEAIVVTTPELGESSLYTRLYDAGDLAAPINGPNRNDLAKLIEQIIEPAAWERDGGPGSILALPGALVVSHTLRVHRQVERLLTFFCASTRRRMPLKHLSRSTKRNRRSWLRCARVTIKLSDQPLVNAIRSLADAEKLTLVMDVGSRPLRDSAPLPRVSGEFVDRPLSEVLDKLFANSPLTWRVTSGMLLVTTPDVAGRYLSIRFYPAKDLLAATELPRVPDPAGTRCGNGLRNACPLLRRAFPRSSFGIAAPRCY